MQELKDYKLLDNWEMTKDLAIKLQGLGTIAFFVFAWLFGSLYFWLTGTSASIYTDITSNTFLSIIFLLTNIFAIYATHELIHGFFIKKYGAKPVYGFGLAYYIMPYFYAAPKEKTVFTRSQFITILLAPLMGISTIGILFMLAFPSVSQWILLPLIVNASGAIGDMWMTRTLLRYPKHIMIADDKNGITIYGNKDDESLNIAPSGFMRVFVRNTLGFFFAITIFMLVILPILLAVLKVSSFTIGPRGSIFTIFEYTRSDRGGSFNARGVLLPAIMLSALAELIHTVLKAGHKEKYK